MVMMVVLKAVMAVVVTVMMVTSRKKFQLLMNELDIQISMILEYL